jgi:hypothetical protein
LLVLDFAGRRRELERRQARRDRETRQGEPGALGTHQPASRQLDERTRDSGGRGAQAAAEHEGRSSTIEPGELEQGAQHARFVGRELHGRMGRGDEDTGGLLGRHARRLAHT